MYIESLFVAFNWIARSRIYLAYIVYNTLNISRTGTHFTRHFFYYGTRRVF